MAKETGEGRQQGRAPAARPAPPGLVVRSCPPCESQPLLSLARGLRAGSGLASSWPGRAGTGLAGTHTKEKEGSTAGPCYPAPQSQSLQGGGKAAGGSGLQVRWPGPRRPGNGSSLHCSAWYLSGPWLSSFPLPMSLDSVWTVGGSGFPVAGNPGPQV